MGMFFYILLYGHIIVPILVIILFLFIHYVMNDIQLTRNVLVTALLVTVGYILYIVLDAIRLFSPSGYSISIREISSIIGYVFSLSLNEFVLGLFLLIFIAFLGAVLITLLWRMIRKFIYPS